MPGPTFQRASSGSHLVPVPCLAAWPRALRRGKPCCRTVSSMTGNWWHRLREEGAHVTPLGPGSFDSTSAAERLQKLFRVATLEPFGRFSRADLSAMGALADYVDLTQRGATALLRPPVREAGADSLQIDPATRRNLELSTTLAGVRVRQPAQHGGPNGHQRRCPPAGKPAREPGDRSDGNRATP